LGKHLGEAVTLYLKDFWLLGPCATYKIAVPARQFTVFVFRRLMKRNKYLSRKKGLSLTPEAFTDEVG
jgi:hypothetical protein